MHASPEQLKEYTFSDSLIANHECGAESPYLDNALQLIEWMRGHVCVGKVMSIGEFAEEVRASCDK